MSNQLQITGGAKVRALEGVITGTSGVLSSVPLGAANGVATLDSGGKVPVSQLPSSVVTYLGTWNAATNTPTLVNGTGDAGDLYICNVAGTVNFGAGPIVFVVGDWVLYGSGTWQKSSGQNGTVTSVAASITGNSLGITGSPITTAGTLAFAFAGTSGQYINGAGNLTTFPTLITSIGLSMPSAFSVANSPLTANGSINVTGAGTTGQYIRGDGSLATYNPGSGGGGSSQTFYFNGGVASSVTGYQQMSTTANTGASADFSVSSNGYIASFLTDSASPNQLLIPAGNWNFEIYMNSSSSGGSPNFYVELYKYNGSTFTLISSSSANPEYITNGTAVDLYTTALTVPQTTLTLTDRLAVRVYVVTSGRTITMHTQDSNLSEVITTFSTGITALNGLTAQVQNFAVGTGGSDFNISSVTDTHTFNLPTASSTKRGALSSADWSTFNNKQAALSGTGFVKISGTTISYDNSTYYLASNPSSFIPLTALSFAAGSGAYNSTTGVITIPTNNNQITNGAGYTTNVGTVTSVAATGGTGISISGSPITTSGTITITNTAPDQTVALTASTGISISGTYPNFTITNTSPSSGGTVTSVAMTVPTGLSISGSPITSSGTLAVTLTAGYSIPTTASQTNWDTAYTNRITSLTTTGSSGSATLVSNTLNVPTYTLSGLGGQPLATNLTSLAGLTYASISFVKMTASGTFALDTNTYYLASNPSGFTSNTGTVTSIGLSSSTSGVTIGSTPVTSSGTITIAIATATTSQNGLISSTDWTTFNGKQAALNGTGFVKASGTTISYDNSTYITGNQTITLSGDVSGSGATAITTTIGALKVTNAMLAGTINYSKMDATTVPTWNQNTTGTASYANVLNVYAGNEATIANGWAVVGGGDLYINYRGATGVGITGYVMANGLSTGTQVPVKASSFIGGGSALTSLPTNTALYPTLNQNTTGTAANITATSNATLTTLSALSLPYSQLTGTPSIPSVSGTTNYLPKFTGTSTIGNSAITDDGTTVTLVSRALSGVSALFTNATSGDYLTLRNSTPSIGGGEAISFVMDYTQSASSTGWKILSRYAGGNLQFVPNYQNAGYNTPALSLNYNGAATFSSSVQAVSGIFKGSYYNTITEVGVTSYYGSALYLSGDAGSDQRTWRMTTKYASPNVALAFEYSTSALSYGSNPTGLTYAEAMRFSPTGAATFSSSVTAGGDIIVNNSSNPYSAAGRGSIFLNGSSTSLYGWGVGGSAKGYMYHEGTNVYLENSVSGGFFNLTQVGAGFFSFNTNSSERMRITSGGNVLIGTTTDATGKLQVNGTVYATGFYESSDIRLKTILEKNPIVDLKGIEVIKFTRNDSDINQVRYGYSAQEVQSICSDLVSGNDFLNVNYIDVHTLKIAALEQEIKELKTLLNEK